MSYAQPSIRTPKSATELYDPVAFAAAETINREFISMLSLADDLGDDRMSDIICQLSEAASAMFPDAGRLFEGARALADKLAAVTFEALAEHEISGRRPGDLDAAIRYHGARSADLATRLAQVI